MPRLLMCLALGSIAGACIAVVSAQAQPSFEARGHIALSFAEDRLVQRLTVPPLQAFDVYVLVEFDNPTEQPAMWGVEAGLRFHPSISFNSTDWYDSSSHIMLSLGPGLMQILETWSECRAPGSGLGPIAHLRAVAGVGVTNALIGIEAVDGGSFDGLGPGWHACGSNAQYLFQPGVGSSMQLTLNPTVATEGSSWSAMKASFGQEAP